MPVGSQQAIADEESGTGDASANFRMVVGESDLVDAVDVSNGIAVTVQTTAGMA